MISWKLAAERSARAEDVVAQQHPQQKQNADGNAHHVAHQVSDPSALLAPNHFSLLRRRVASHAGESRACASSAQRQRPENNGRGGRREAQGCILCTGCRSFTASWSAARCAARWNLRALLARLRETDRDGLLPAGHLAAAPAAPQRASLLATHRRCDGALRLLAVPSCALARPLGHGCLLARQRCRSCWESSSFHASRG